MIAMTTTSARPAIESAGTSGMSRLSCESGGMSSSGSGSFTAIPLEDLQVSVADDEASGVAELIHQRQVVGGDDDRGAGFVQFDEQPQQAARQRGVDVAGRLVGEQQFGPHDQRAGDRRALLLAAGEHRRQGVHAIAEADPAQELDDFGAIAAFVAAHHPQRQRDVFVGREMVEQPKVLEHDADSPPERRDLVLVESWRRPRRKCGSFRASGAATSSISRSIVVLPAPDGPVRN